MTNRIAWIDVAKGIGICLVVFGHVERGLAASNILDRQTWSAGDFYLYTFHMPLFMFIAGLNSPQSRNKPRFLTRKALSIMYPYVVWSLIQGSAMALLAQYTNGAASWQDVGSILWKPISPFWFLYVLFFFTIAVRVIKPSMTMLAASLLMLIVSPWIGQYVLFNMFYFYFYFVGGYMLSGRIGRISTPVAIASLCAFAAWTTLVYRYAPLAYNSPLVLPSAGTGIIVTLWLSQQMSRLWVLAYLGAISLAIYVMHILATAGTRIILVKFFHIGSPAVHFTAGIMAGVVGPILVYEAMRQLKISKYFGLTAFPPPSPRHSTMAQ